MHKAKKFLELCVENNIYKDFLRLFESYEMVPDLWNWDWQEKAEEEEKLENRGKLDRMEEGSGCCKFVILARWKEEEEEEEEKSLYTIKLDQVWKKIQKGRRFATFMAPFLLCY